MASARCKKRSNSGELDVVGHDQGTQSLPSWRTIEHETHVEYQSVIKDLVLVSEYLAPS